MFDNPNSGEWTCIIRPKNRWFDIHLSELWRYRDLVMLFVRRDFVAVYKQTVLGPLWFLLQPLFTTLVFTVIFGKIANIPTGGVPQLLFYMSGIVVWNYFSNCLNATSNTFVANAVIFGKVYFPRLTVPLSIVISNLITFIIQLSLFLAFYCYFYVKGAILSPSPLLLMVPVLVLQSALLGLGVGIIVSSLTTKYRDLSYLVSFGVQLWMFASPVVYPSSLVPERWRWLLGLNPVTPIIETFRYAFLGVGGLQLKQLILSWTITSIVLLIGIVLFSRIEKGFMDTV